MKRGDIYMVSLDMRIIRSWYTGGRTENAAYPSYPYSISRETKNKIVFF